MARAALKKYDADIMKAAEELLANGGIMESDFDDDYEGKSLVYFTNVEIDKLF